MRNQKSCVPTRMIFNSILTMVLVLAGAGATQATHCPADFDCSGDIDTADLSFVLGEWGQPKSPADLNGDNDVGCFDLTYILGNWGPCRCDGDVDGNGEVDAADQAIVLASWNNACSADLDQNGFIDGNDIDMVLCQWGTSDPTTDFDGDGSVGSSDLAIALAAVGIECRGDLDHDGTVGTNDLLAVLGNWGSCEI